jgi:hypothetical protein
VRTTGPPPYTRPAWRTPSSPRAARRYRCPVYAAASRWKDLGGDGALGGPAPRSARGERSHAGLIDTAPYGA